MLSAFAIAFNSCKKEMNFQKPEMVNLEKPNIFMDVEVKTEEGTTSSLKYQVAQEVEYFVPISSKILLYSSSSGDLFTIKVYDENQLPDILYNESEIDQIFYHLKMREGIQ